VHNESPDIRVIPGLISIGYDFFCFGLFVPVPDACSVKCVAFCWLFFVVVVAIHCKAMQIGAIAILAINFVCANWRERMKCSSAAN